MRLNDYLVLGPHRQHESGAGSDAWSSESSCKKKDKENRKRTFKSTFLVIIHQKYSVK